MKTNYRSIVVLLPLLCLVATLSISTARAEGETVKMVVMYTLTGTFANSGTKEMDGAKFAIKEINERGGVNLGAGRVKIEAVYEDSAGDPQLAVRKMEGIVANQKIMTLIGGIHSGETLALECPESADSISVLLLGWAFGRKCSPPKKRELTRSAWCRRPKRSVQPRLRMPFRTWE